MADFELPYVNADEALTPKWQLVDVRKLRAREESNLELSGAVWIDPYDLSPQHPVFAEASRLLFFCVHGHEVSQYATAMGLLAGSDAAYVRGGFEALRAAGAPAQTLKGVA